MLRMNGTTGSRSIKLTADTYPSTDSTYTNGTQLLYWKETYTDKLFLNSTATLDGSTAGTVALIGKLGVTGTNGTLTISADTDGGDFNIGSNASGTLAIYGSGGNTLGVKLLDGDIEIGDTAKGVILTAPNASRWRITVDNSGNLTTTSI